MKGLSRFKPGVARHTLLCIYAIFWTAIGVLLIIKGAYYLRQLNHRQTLIVVSGIVVGCLKSYFILDKSVRSGVNRILTFEDGTCLGAVYSFRTWILILCMMAMGAFLRSLDPPVALLCFLYFSIGWALLLSSRYGWILCLRRK